MMGAGRLVGALRLTLRDELLLADIGWGFFCRKGAAIFRTWVKSYIC